MRRKNISLGLLLGLIALTSLFSCGEDRWAEYYPLTGRDLWIDSVMREDYLWYDEMPSFNDLNYFQTPANFLDDVISSKDDGFSSVDTLNNDPVIGYGFDYTLSTATDNDTAYYAMITYVIPDSPAAEAGLERGEWIMMVDGDYITADNDSILDDGESRTITVGKYTATTVTDEDGEETTTYSVVADREATLSAARVVEDAVIPISTVLDGNVGYLVYNSFDADADADLLEFSSLCHSSGVTDFVLDLRYNTGGSMESAQLLASILAPSGALGSTFTTLEYNDKKTDKNRSLTFDTQLLSTGSNLNLSTVYILTGSETAATAEMLINGLTPYMNVVLIGETTEGIYIGTEDFLSNTYLWVLRLAVCQLFNANGEADYTSGFSPDYSVSPLSDPTTVLPLGNSDEALLSVALGLIDGTTSASAKATTTSIPVKSVKVRRHFRGGILLNK
ncbi:MAG: S41 family peptidase [Bacteroides sp.]|nr:S41 family peptidase [Bacteroides sp.]